jgi:hypothetical protein
MNNESIEDVGAEDHHRDNRDRCRDAEDAEPQCVSSITIFVRVPQTPKVTPAMVAGVIKRLWEVKDFVNMIEAWEASR